MSLTLRGDKNASPVGLTTSPAALPSVTKLPLGTEITSWLRAPAAVAPRLQSSSKQICANRWLILIELAEFSPSAVFSSSSSNAVPPAPGKRRNRRSPRFQCCRPFSVAEQFFPQRTDFYRAGRNYWTRIFFPCHRTREPPPRRYRLDNVAVRIVTGLSPPMRHICADKTPAEVFSGQRRTMEQPVQPTSLTCATGAGERKRRADALFLVNSVAVFHANKCRDSCATADVKVLVEILINFRQIKPQRSSCGKVPAVLPSPA